MKKHFSIVAASVAACTALVVGCSSKEETTPNASGQPEAKKNITVSIYDRGTVPPAEGTMEDNRWTKWLNEKGPANVKFVAIPRFESIQKFNTLFASGSAPDLIFEYDTAYRSQLYNQKQLMPLDDLIEKHAPNYKRLLQKYPMIKSVATKSDGKMYELGKTNVLTPNHTLFIRADWLKKLNLEVPKTTEDLLKVAKAFTEQDPDGNGKKDTYGIGLSFVGGVIIDYAFGVGKSSTGVAYTLKDGKVINAWEQTKAAVDYKKQLFEAGVVDKDFLADTKGEKAKQDWITGKLGIYGANGGAGDITLLRAFIENNPTGEYIPISLPETKFGKFSPVIMNPVQMVAAINSSTKNPDAVMKYYDFLLSDNTAKVLRHGIEGEHYNVVNGCPTDIDPNKNKVERVYTGDMAMMLSGDPSNKCLGYMGFMNPIITDKTSELDKKAFTVRASIATEAMKLYVDKNRPMGALTHDEHLPALPQDLQLNYTNASKAINDIWSKAILSGNNYTTDAALKDAMAAWEKAGGAKVDEYYAKWYDSNKGKVLLTQDMYQFAAK